MAKRWKTLTFHSGSSVTATENTKCRHGSHHLFLKKNNLWRKLLVTADRINCLKFSVLGCLTSWATVGQQETVTLCSSEKNELTIRLVEAASLHLYLARPSSTSRTGKLRWPRTASPHRPRWRQTRGTDRSDCSPGCPPEERRQAQTKKNRFQRLKVQKQNVSLQFKDHSRS